MGEGILADYAVSLLSIAAGKHIIIGMPIAFGEGDVRSRIRNLMNRRKPASWMILTAGIVCAVLAVCLLTNPMLKRFSEYRIQTEDIAEYAEYFGEDAKHRKNKMLAIDIFPKEIPSSAQIEQFCYEYYNP